MRNDLLTVRKAERSDLSALDALFAKSYPAILKSDYPPSVLVTAIPRIAKANPRLIETGSYFVVADSHGELVGAGGWTPSAPPGFQGSERVGHIRHVVTDVKRLRQGIGTSLMDRILQTSKTAGVDRLDCLSTRTAVPFYASCGFRELGPVAVPLAQGIDFPAVRMQRLLDQR